MCEMKQNDYYLQQEKNVITELKEEMPIFQQYLELNEEWRQRFLDFCTGKKTLPITYDPFFKHIFHPDIHPQRLSRFISSLIQKEVTVIHILPTEDNPINKEALLVMDILVELEDHSLANVEIQKIPYFFPAERMSCYSADLLLRQYSRIKESRGKSFKYNDVKKVYTIILFEKTTDVFHEIPDQYIHMGRTTFNTGLKLELLQEYCLVALDVFRKIPYPKERNERTAWISFLTTESVEDALVLAEQYPWLIEIYKEITEYMCSPKEVLGMFSEALHILDRNTANYMIEEQQADIEAKKKIIEEQKRILEENQKIIEEQDEKLEENQKIIEEQDEKLEENQKIIEAQDEKLEENQKIIEEQDEKLEESQKIIEEQNRILEENRREVERLRQLLEKSRRK